MNNNDNNDGYVSLYDYLGKASRESGLGKEVTKTAVERGIKIKYKLLPNELQTSNYKHVHTYPISFLNEYFSDNIELANNTLLRVNALKPLTDRIKVLEEKINQLLTQNYQYDTNNYERNDEPGESDEYDLPF